MPKAYCITPQLRNGSKSYSATFKNASGEKVVRGLNTQDEAYAKKLCSELVWAFEKQLQSSEGLSPHAARLYFGEGVELHAPTVAPSLARVYEQLEDYPVECRARLLPKLLELDKLHEKNEALRKDLSVEKRKVIERDEALAALRRTIEGRQIEAGKKVLTRSPRKRPGIVRSDDEG